MTDIANVPHDHSLTLKPQRLEGSDHCLNCGTELKGPFCYYCGQPDKRFLRFFPVMIREMLTDLFELDSRFSRTLKPLLFHPGRLTRDYIDGRRFRYTPPIRIYLFASVIFFLLASAASSLFDWSAGVTISNGADTDTETSVELTPEQIENIPIEVRDEVLKELDDLGGMDEDEFHIQFNEERWDPVTNPAIIPLMPDRFNNWLNEEIGNSPQKAKQISENPKLIVDIAMDILPQVVFILLPVFALIMKFWYLFAKKFYIEHLIFSLHNHSFLFVIFLAMMALTWLEAGAESMGWVGNSRAYTFEGIQALLVFWIPIYMLLAMKRVYQQGWILTFVKYCTVGFSYSIVLSIVMFIAAAIGFLTF